MRIAKRYLEKAKVLLAREGHATDDESVQRLALLLRSVKALDKPKTILAGYIVVSFQQNELGDTDANLAYEFYNDRGLPQTPSAEFAVWLLETAADTAAESLPSGDDEQ
jgi:hypothetical protein